MQDFCRKMGSLHIWYQTAPFLLPSTVHQSPAFLLFESVTGRALFYDSAGALLNFDYDTHKPLSGAMPLEITISRPGGKGGKTIVISHLSGRIIVKGNEEQN